MADRFAFVDDMFANERPDRFSFVDDMFEPQTSVTDAFTSGVRKGFAGIGEQAWNLAGSLSDTVSPYLDPMAVAKVENNPQILKDTWHRFATGLQRLGDVADVGRQGAQSMIKAENEAYPTDPYSLPGAVNIASEGVTRMIPQIGAFAAGGVPAGIGYAATEQATQRQQQLLDEGKDLGTASLAGIGQGAFTAGTEYLMKPLDFMTAGAASGGLGKQILKRGLGSGVAEGTEEVIQGAYEDLTDAVMNQELPSLDKFAQDSLQRGYAGAITGGALGAGRGVQDSLTSENGSNTDIPDVDSLIEQDSENVTVVDDVQEQIDKLPLAEEPESLNIPSESRSFSDEEGTANIIQDAINPIVEQAQHIADKLDERFISNESFAAKRNLGKNLTQNSKAEKEFGSFDQTVSFPKTVANKYKNVTGNKEVYQAGRQLAHNTATHMVDFKDSLNDYASLPKAERVPVDKFVATQRIAAAKGKQLPETPEYLKSKWGMNDAQIKSVQALRTTLSEVAPEKMRESLLARAVNDEESQKINEMIDTWKQQPYVPFGRTGDWYVYVPEYATDESETNSYFERFKTRREMANRIKELQEQNFTEDNYRYGEIAKIDPSIGTTENMNLSPELAMMMKQFDGGEGRLQPELKGFKKHRIKAKLTPGFDEDISQSVAEYLSGMSSQIAHEQFDREFNSAYNQIPANEVKLRNYWQRYYEYLKDPSKEAPKIRQGLALWYLTRPMSGFVNATQNIQTTIPLLTEQVGATKSYGYWAKAHAKLGKFMAGNKEFKSSELGQALSEYYKAENLADSASTMLKNLKTGKAVADDKDGIKKYANLMGIFQAAEDLNRGHAFIAGWDVATNKGMSGQARVDFAQEFVDDSQFVYSKANRPEMARGGVKATLTTFRLFFGNLQRFMRDRGVSKAGLQFVLHALALGGASAIPFVREAEKLLKVSGYDTDKLAEEFLPEDMASIINMGLVGTYSPLDLSGSLSAGELVPGIEDSPMVAAGKTILGVPGGFVTDFTAGLKLINEGYARQGVEKMLPAAARGFSKAERWSEDQTFRGNDNLPIPETENPSLTDIIITAAGGLPSKLSKAYDKAHKEYVITEEARDNRNVNNRLGDAIFRMTTGEDDTQLRSILEEIRDHNASAEPHQVITPNIEWIKDRIIKQVAGKYAGRQSSPKKARAKLDEVRNTN